MFNPIADFLAMRRDIAKRSRVLNAWGFMLNVPTLVGSLFFLNTTVGVAVALAIVVSVVIASQMHKRWPLSRLLGLCHIVFLPVLWLLFVEAGAIGKLGLFEIWLLYALIMMTLCVLIDIFDLFRYFVLRNREYVSGQ